MVLVTRPRPDADRTAALLEARGFSPLIDPVLQVRPVPGPPLDLTGVQGLLVTSVNGVRAAAARTPVRDLPVFAVGSRTAEVARTLGFREVRDAGGSGADLAALVMLTADPAAGRMVHISGAELAVDLAALLGPRGFRIARIVGYEAVPSEALSPETTRAFAEGTVMYALFFSPRTARTFVTLIAQGGLADRCGTAEALCLSPAVAAALAVGPMWRQVRTAARPDQDALLDLLPT